jgi:hypothetical protein
MEEGLESVGKMARDGRRGAKDGGRSAGECGKEATDSGKRGYSRWRMSKILFKIGWRL